MEEPAVFRGHLARVLHGFLPKLPGDGSLTAALSLGCGIAGGGIGNSRQHVFIMASTTVFQSRALLLATRQHPRFYAPAQSAAALQFRFYCAPKGLAPNAKFKSQRSAKIAFSGDFTFTFLRFMFEFMEPSYSTGQAAKALRVTAQTIRNLVASGFIKAKKSAGGHLRIGPAELQRLRAMESLPRATRPSMPMDGPPATKKNAHELLAEPSQPVIEAAETAYVSGRELASDENRLRRLKIHREATELVDYFADREQRGLDRAVEEQRLEAESATRRRQEREAAETAAVRRAFESRWMSYALSTAKPWDVPSDYALLVRSEVMSALAETVTNEDQWTVARLVEAAIARALQPWRDGQARLEAKHRAVESALSDLPFWMKHDDAWRPRARQIAEESVNSARDGATASQMAIAAKLALNPLRAEYEHAERIKQAMAFVSLQGSTREDIQDAKTGVREALEGLPVGASDRQIEAAKVAALVPIRERIAARIRLENEAEERRQGKRRLMDLARREVTEYARRMLKEFEYDNDSSLDIELRTCSEVERVLHEELTGSETDGKVRFRVHEIMEEAEGCK